MQSYELFRYLMYKKNIRKADVIRGTGITRPTLLKWERSGNASLRTLRAVADYFEIPVTDFLEGGSEK